jgi:hypothetical protein
VNAAPTSYTINGTGGSGADIAGADITLAGGQSTGLGIGGPVIIKAANPAAGTGSVLNALVEVARFVGDQANAPTNNQYSAGFLTLRSVQKNVQGDSPVTINVADSNRVYTNEGAGAGVQFNLPSAETGLTYTFIVQAAQTVTVDAADGDTIQLAGSVSVASGNCASATVGNVVVLVAINAAEWVAVSIVGAWIVT